MIDILLKFAQKAGQKIKNSQKNIEKICNKDDSVASVVTKTDIYVSDLFTKTIQKHFSHLNYMIIDEEKISKYGNKVFDAVKSSEYQFVIDPIDGTIQFANKHPLYGISVGVYKKAKPYMGILYLPELNQLIYFDFYLSHIFHFEFLLVSLTCLFVFFVFLIYPVALQIYYLAFLIYCPASYSYYLAF